ncbi:hypothetical protein D1007_07669 [Hordeum vulgare]|nr:hypothetical protein D1007_07669 [Hordeum vulgare]
MHGQTGLTIHRWLQHHALAGFLTEATAASPGRSRPSNPCRNMCTRISPCRPAGSCTRRGRTSLQGRAHTRNGRCTSLPRHQSAAPMWPGPERRRKGRPGARRR